MLFMRGVLIYRGQDHFIAETIPPASVGFRNGLKRKTLAAFSPLDKFQRRNLVQVPKTLGEISGTAEADLPTRPG